MYIRSAHQNDLGAIEHIESSAPSPWSRPLISTELRQPDSIQLVALKKDTQDIIGWCCARLFAPEAELLKISVTPLYRRSGAGSLLLQGLIDRCQTAGCREMFLEVREKNHGARSFYSTFGFIETGKRKRYFSDPVDNGVILKKSW